MSFAFECLDITDTMLDHSGLVVANRLTEDPSVTVAVIEAGPDAEDLPEVRSFTPSQRILLAY